MPRNPPLREWRGKTVWLVGASTGIGHATAAALYAQGATVVVSARGTEALDRFRADYAGARTLALDVGDRAAVQMAARSLTEAPGGLDCVMYCAGYYRAMRADAFDLDEMLRHEQVNYVGALYVLNAVLPHFVARRAGHISLVSSVAGFRGLPQGLGYGPTKAALINLAETLYLDLHEQGVGVSLITPGFVETRLTAQNAFAMPALISSAQAAQEILAGWRRGAFDIHFPKRFTLWMKLLRLLPYGLYFAVVRRVTGL